MKIIWGYKIFMYSEREAEIKQLKILYSKSENVENRIIPIITLQRMIHSVLK